MRFADTSNRRRLLKGFKELYSAAALFKGSSAGFRKGLSAVSLCEGSSQTSVFFGGRGGRSDMSREKKRFVDV